MHYANLVVIPKPEKDITKEYIEQSVQAIMERGEGDWWDWYQIGGRWTGIFDGYDPDKDTNNIVPCELCGGTGDRKDLEPPEWKEECGGCNGCHGTGKTVTWPTRWGTRMEDIIPISSLTEEQLKNFFRVVTSDKIFGGEDYLPWVKDKDGKPDYEKMFPKKEMPPLSWIISEYNDCLGVIVDNHN